MRRKYTLLFILVSLVPSLASADSENPLEGQPAVRHRVLMRTGRFEIGPSMGFSINRTYRQAIMFGGKLQYHITDYLAIGGEFTGGVGMDTGLTSEIESSYAGNEATWQALHDNMSDITLAGDVRAVFTPFAGKLSLFSAAFLAYDFYLFGGLGFAMLSNNTANPGVDETNEGFRPGIACGVGTRLFFNRYMALGIEFKDLLFSDNESGGDITRGLSPDEAAAGNTPIVDGDDREFLNHFFVGLNFTFLLPTNPEVSN